MKTLYTTILACTFIGFLNGQTYFSDDFEPGSGAGGSLTNNNAWTTQVVVASTSGFNWIHDDFGGDAFAEVSNYNSTTSTNEVMQTWLITPVIDLSASTMPVLNFNNMKRFPGDDLIVNISTDYSGSGSPLAASWTDITSSCTMDANTGSWSFVNSGDVDITTAVSGSPSTVYLAFQYSGGVSDGSVYEIDDVIIQEGPISVPSVPIYDIQYTTSPGGNSPYDGQVVTTGGIVTALVNSAGDVGYFIQSGSGAWNGIYVNDASNIPARGDSVTVTGMVQENFNFTRITAVSAYNVVSGGNPEPAAWPVATIEVNYEDFEGVLVRAASAECTNPSVGFGQWAIYDGSTDTCLVDDIIYSYVPVLGNVYDVTGPVWFSYSEFKLLPRDAADISGSSLQFTVYNIQYTTDPGGFSPFNGTDVTNLKGIVTAESSGAFNADERGYWIQDGSGAWHGIFVRDSINTPAIGDSVLIDGNVNENFNQTIIRNVTSFNVLNSGNTLPNSPIIATDSVNLEKYEGVLVTTEYAACTNPSMGFGQWEINDGTGPALIDDIIYSYPSPLLGTQYRVTGPVYYSYSEYKILPRAAIDVEVFAGIDEVNSISKLFPNPAKDVLMIESSSNGQVEVVDMAGRIVLQTTIAVGMNQLNISSLDSGSYLLRTADATGISRFIVE